MLAQTARVLVTALSLTSVMIAQPTLKDDMIDILIGAEGITLETAVEWASTTTNRPFQYKDASFRGKPRIMMTGKVSIEKDRIFEFWQAIFATQDFAMIPLGPNDGDFIMLEPIDQSRNLKQRATFVPSDRLDEYRHRIGEVIMTTITLKHVEVQSARPAIQLLMPNRSVEFSQDVPTANAMIICGFAPTVFAVRELLTAMDIPPVAATLKFETISLKHAVAEELEPQIRDLITTTTQGGAPGARPVPRGGDTRPGQQIPEPKIISDSRTNSLVVYAVERDMNEIKRLIAALDTEVTDIDSNIRIYFLKNTNATDLERTLRDLLGQSTSRTATNVGGRPGAAGATSANQRGREVVIVADSNTNSLLIQASKTRYEEIEPLINELDKRRPQVLVHAAIAELSDNDLQNIAVELTAVEGGDDRYRFAGATGYGLSQITFDTTSGTGTVSGTGTGTGTGMGDPGTGSSTSGNLFDDLVRIPFANDTGIGFSGLVAGIFERNLNVPLLVAMLKTYTKVNLLSNASVLTNDNEQSSIEVGRTLNVLRTDNLTNGGTSTTATDEVSANLTLSISPHISNDNYLRLNIEFTVEAFQGATDAINGIPPPRTSRAFNGAVTVPNGKTVVIGGLVQDNTAESIQSVPFLGDIPILGELFKSTNTEIQKTTLYLFVTPTIINDFQQLEEISYERKLEIQKLDGNISLVDPNFRAVGIRDSEIDIDAIEDAGLLDMPRYSPVTPIGQAVKPRDVTGNPVHPDKGSEGAATIHDGGTLKFRGGRATRDDARSSGKK